MHAWFIVLQSTWSTFEKLLWWYWPTMFLLFVLYALLYRFKIRYLVRETIHNFSCSTTMPWLRESRFMFCWVLVNSTSTIIYTMLWTYVWNYLIIEYLHQRKRNIDLKWCNISVISRIYFAPLLKKITWLYKHTWNIEQRIFQKEWKSFSFWNIFFLYTNTV